jgi:hypothetical protein
MTTDTPRTDAIEFRHCPPQPEAILKKHEDAYALSRQLERELGLSKAEVAEIRNALGDDGRRTHKEILELATKASGWKLKAESEVRELNSLMIGWKQRATMSETDLEASKAEVERLTEALKSCWHAANTYDGNYARACDNVAIIITNALKTQDR